MNKVENTPLEKRNKGYDENQELERHGNKSFMNEKNMNCDKTGWWLKKAISQCLRNERIKGRSSKQKNGVENGNFCHKWTWKASLQIRIERSCWKINNETNKLVVGLWKTSQDYEVTTGHKWKPLIWLRAPKRWKTSSTKMIERLLGSLISTTIATFLREGFRWNMTQDNSNEEVDWSKRSLERRENDGFKIPHSWQHMNHETWRKLSRVT